MYRKMVVLVAFVFTLFLGQSASADSGNVELPGLKAHWNYGDTSAFVRGSEGPGDPVSDSPVVEPTAGGEEGILPLPPYPFSSSRADFALMGEKLAIDKVYFKLYEERRELVVTIVATGRKGSTAPKDYNDVIWGPGVYGVFSATVGSFDEKWSILKSSVQLIGMGHLELNSSNLEFLWQDNKSWVAVLEFRGSNVLWYSTMLLGEE